MKPDGVTMETLETTEAAAVAELSNPPDNSSEQVSQPLEQPAAVGPPNTATTANGKTAGAKTAVAATKKSSTESTSGSRPGVSSRRPVNEVRPNNSVSLRTAPAKKPPAPLAKLPGATTVPKKTLGGASGSTLTTTKTQAKMTDKKSSGSTSAATAVTNGTKPANSLSKKTLTTTKPRTTAPVSRTTGPAAPKPSTTSSTKPNAAVAPMKPSRPVTARTSHQAAKPSTTTTANKPPSTAKTTAFRAATAPSSGKATAAQPNKITASTKKDFSRPAAAAVTARKTAPPTTATKKPDVSKPAVNVKFSTASAKVDLKPPLKPQQSVKVNATKKPAAAAARFPAVNRVGQTPPGSPVSKSPSSTNTSRPKVVHKPTQAVSSFTPGKKAEKMGAAKVAIATSNKADGQPEREVPVTKEPLVAAAMVQETHMEPDASFPQEQKHEATETGKESAAAESTLLETIDKHTESNTVFALQSPVRPAVPQIEQHQPIVPSLPTDEPASLESPLYPVALPLQSEALLPETLMSHSLRALSENGSPQVMPLNNLNEEEEEEEKDGSQLVSVSEMSGTTQPTEESRPGSAGLVGASAWRVGGALLSELDSEEVSVSQQGASELSAPGVLEGTESMDDLGEGSLKGAMDMEGASAGSPDFEKVPEIPVNDYDDDDDYDDDNDRVCDMDVGSERTDEVQRLRHDNDVYEEEDEDEDEDVEMASEGVTESGLESYGNADEDDFAEDERLDNLNRVAQPPPAPPLLPSAPAAQWDQPNPFADPWAETVLQQHLLEPGDQPRQGAEAAGDSPVTDPCQGDSETPTQEPNQTWFELDSATLSNENRHVPQTSSGKKDEQTPEPIAAAEPTVSVAPLCAPGTSPLSIISKTSTPDEINLGHNEQNGLVPQPELSHGKTSECVPVDEVLGSAHAPASNPSSSSVTEDEASDMEGEAQLEDTLETPVICNVTFDSQPHGQRCLSTVEEGDEPEDICLAEVATPLSATSQVSYGFDTTNSASNSNAQSTSKSCVKSPRIFSLEELSEEVKEPPLQPSLLEQPYIECGEREVVCEQAMVNKLENLSKVYPSSPEPHELEQMPLHDDAQPPYFSALCEKTESSFAGFSALLHPQRRDHSSYPRTYCDIVKPVNAALASPKLSCADLPPRSPKQQPLSPQLRRLEQHQRHLLELQQRREQQSRPLEEAEQERKRREEEEERKKKDEAEEEIKRNKEDQEKRMREHEEIEKQELEQRKALELQLQQQQEELKQRQQIMQWQQELQDSNKGQPLLLSPSSGLCTIYESQENSDDEDGTTKCEEETVKKSVTEVISETHREVDSGCGLVTSESQSTQTSQDFQQRLTPLTQNGDYSSTPPEFPDTSSPLDLDWEKKVDIVHQLINQTLLLNADGCSSLLLLPGGAGGTLSPLESSLWPSLLPPLTPPSATVTSVSSFSPETSGSSPQGEWTVVELETHH